MLRLSQFCQRLNVNFSCSHPQPQHVASISSFLGDRKVIAKVKTIFLEFHTSVPSFVLTELSGINSV